MPGKEKLSSQIKQDGRSILPAKLNKNFFI